MAVIRTPIRTVLLLGASTIALCSRPAAADEPPAPEQLQDVIVTANRRQETQQQTAGAVTAVSGEELARSGAVDLLDLSNAVPGLIVNESVGQGRTITIRGLGNLAVQGAGAPSVATHFDGVYMQTLFALNSDFLDLSRVEVQRGPQGPVHGQNSTGGAVNFISNEPTLDRFSGSADVAYGTYNLVHTTGVVNVPLTDELALRAAIGYVRHDGFGEAKNVPGDPNFELDDDNSVTSRISLLYKPSEDFSIIGRAFIYELDAHSREQKNIFDPLTDPRQTSSDYGTPLRTRTQVYSVTAKWDVGPVELTSISAFQENTRSAPQNSDGLDFALARIYNPAPVQGHDLIPVQRSDQRSITQELDIGTRPGALGNLRLFGGVFFQDSLAKGDFVEYQVANASDPIFNSVDKGVLRYIGNGFESATHGTLQQYSLFGQGDYDVFDWLTVTAGTRYTNDDTVGANSTYFGKITPIEESDHAFTGKAQLDFKITPDNHVAVSWSTGFKPGGTNIVPGTVQAAKLTPAAFAPEQNTAYEIDSKNEFFERRLRLNFAAYYYDYTGLHFPEEDTLPFYGGTGSIPKSHIEGFETEFGVILPFNLRLDGNFALQYGRIDSDLLVLDPATSNAINVADGKLGYGLFSPQNIAARAAAVQNVKGNTIPQLPRFSGQVALSRTMDLGELGTLTSRASVNYQSGYNYRIESNAGTDRVPPAAIFNLDFLYEPANGPWTAEFQILNLTDRTALTSRNTDEFGVGSTTVTYVAPFQAIGKVSYKF